MWVASGPPVRAFGVSFPTRMIVVRLRSGALWIDSPTGVPDESLTELGPVRYLVAPTKLHVWRLVSWSARFAQAELWGPPRTPRRYGGVTFTGMLGDEAPAAWASEIDQAVFRGNALLDEVEFFHRATKTLLLCDFVQNYAPQRGRPVLNELARIAGVGGEGGVPLDIRLSFVRRGLARRSLRKILSWDFDRLIPAHGDVRERDAKPFVERAFRWLRA